MGNKLFIKSFLSYIIFIYNASQIYSHTWFTFHRIHKYLFKIIKREIAV